MSLDATRQWLLENTKHRFHNPQRVYGLIISALSEYRSLQPKLAEYVGEDKRRQALLCLHGTLPVVFNGATFNIPVVFWFPQRFPEHPPLAYVTPTRTMVVKVSKHVDERGRVYHPYLANWTDTSALGELFRNLIAIFSAEPPVYSRPPGHTPVAMSMGPPSPALGGGGSMSAATLPLGVPAAMTTSQQQQQQHGDSGTMSMPTLPHVGFIAATAAASRPMTSVESDLASVHTASDVAAPGDHVPAVPKTHHPALDSANASADSIEQELSRISLDPHATAQSTPVVSATPTVTSELAHVQSPPPPPEYKFNPVAGRPPIPMLSPLSAATDPGSKFSGQGLSPLQPMEQAAVASPSVAAGGISGGSGIARPSTADTVSASVDEQPSPPPQHELAEQAAVPVAPTPPPPPSVPHVEPAAATTASVPDPVSPMVPAPAPLPPLPKSPLPSSLLDSEPLDDPKKRLIGYQIAIYDRVVEAVDRSREKHTRLNKELLDQSANLNSGAGVIGEERRQLLDSQRQLSSNISVLENKLNELNEKKAEFPDAANIADVRQAFRGQTPAMEQLFDLAGEIAAIDDTLYVLGKALNDGKLSIAPYMRQVRKLAQQQFMAKALAIKIRGLCALDT
ncbi:suppressor protein stp22 of temperature-sensitive alpha-factor receptor and arginine permease [Coemansia sp. RSA 2424]|nr:suppressor protein stp22 of temperature-sensitive alpha-factor receptor and arginine permease [Coemansia sp. RSA 2424]